MKILQFNPYQCGAGRVGSKMFKPIPTPPHIARLKSPPIPTQPPLQDGKNPRGAKQREVGQNCHPY